MTKVDPAHAINTEADAFDVKLNLHDDDAMRLDGKDSKHIEVKVPNWLLYQDEAKTLPNEAPDPGDSSSSISADYRDRTLRRNNKNSRARGLLNDTRDINGLVVCWKKAIFLATGTRIWTLAQKLLL